MQLPDFTQADIYYPDIVRGFAYKQVDEDLVFKLASLFFTRSGGAKFALGYDMRHFSKEMAALVRYTAKGLGKELIDLGETTLDLMQFAISSTNLDGGIYLSPLTGSWKMGGITLLDKNAIPWEHTGLRSTILALTVNIPEDWRNFPNDLEVNNFHKEYFFHALKQIDPMSWDKPKIVIDGGNGMGGELLKKLFHKIPQVNLIPLYCMADEYFPHHFPNPLNPANLKQLQEKVRGERANFGVAVNQAGDAFVIIDELGNIVTPANFGSLLCEVVSDKKGSIRIGHDQRMILGISKTINDLGCKNVPLNSSLSEVKRSLRELQLDLAYDSLGTAYFPEVFNCSSPFYALCLLIEHQYKTNTSISAQLTKYREQYTSNLEMDLLLEQGKDWDYVKTVLYDLFHDAIPSEQDGLSFSDDHYRIWIQPYHGQFLKIYIETVSALLLKELEDKLLSKLQDFSLNLNGAVEESDLDDILMGDREKFETLLNNIWFTWNPHYILPIIDMYGDGWRKNIPPEALIANYGKGRLTQILGEKSWELTQNLRLFNDYFERPVYLDSRIADNAKFQVLKTNPIAYFCMEYGLMDWLQIYSGGLGMLAGDYMKTASDLGIPVVGVGIFYHQGYLHQDFAPDGRQLEDYIHQDPMDYNMELVKGKDGKQLLIDVILDSRVVKVRAWKQCIGRNALYLLDTNFEENEEWEDRLITGYLYGGDLENRIRQELVLGIAGARLIALLGVTPAIYHMNEGHSGFLVLECTRQLIAEQQLSFQDALALATKKLVFTNHTLKQAGNDIFDYMLFERYLTPYAQDLKTDVNTLFNLGDDKTYSQGGFSMTVFGLRHAKVSNAVSKLHAKAAGNVWPEYPLVAVTNGVHTPTWVSPEIHRLLDETLGEDWHSGVMELDFDKILKISPLQLWQAHMARKEKLINSLNSELGLKLRTDVLTLAWSRRLAQYKRPDLLITDIERLKKIVGDYDQPVQILIAGKSHPKDGIGKQILQKMNQCFETEFFHNKVEIIPGYNWQLARRMVSGADIWLNTPFRYEEACGTSGMKASANGVLQLTTLDGWTDEVDWFKKGWVINEDSSAESLYATLEERIVPLYYNRNRDGFNDDWTAMMLNTMQLALQQFSGERMLKDYLDLVYSKIL